MEEHTPRRAATFTDPTTTTTLSVPGATLRLVFEAAHGGAFSVLEFQAGPGFNGPPVPHHHTREEASFLVLEGELSLSTGGADRRLGPGSMAHLPPGVDFTWRNASAEAPARFLCVYAPAGFEQMFRATAQAVAERGGPVSPETMRAVMPGVWARFGVGVGAR